MTVRMDEDPALPLEPEHTYDDRLLEKLQAIFDKTAPNKLMVECVPCEVKSVETLFSYDSTLTLNLHLIVRVKPRV